MKNYSNSLPAIVGASCLSEFFTHPFEALKIQSQIRFNKTGIRPSRFQIFNYFVKRYGYKSLYRGFSAGIFRAVQIQTIRLRLYDTFIKVISRPKGATHLQQLPAKFGSAFLSGLVAGIIGNPWVVLKVRMVTDKTGEHATLRKAILSVIRQDGYQELTKGTSVTVAKGVLLSAIELSVYDTLKHVLKNKTKHEQTTFFCSSLVAGFTAAFFTYPLDVVATIYMNQHSQGNNEKRGFRQIGSIFKDLFVRHGPKGFYSGFTGFASRTMAYGPVFWNSLEFFNKFSRKEYSNF